jgi:hypothetical protein
MTKSSFSMFDPLLGTKKKKKKKRRRKINLIFIIFHEEEEDQTFSRVLNRLHVTHQNAGTVHIWKGLLGIRHILGGWGSLWCPLRLT